MSIEIPVRPTIGNPDIICDRNSYTIVATNQVVTTNGDHTQIDGTALAQSIRYYGFPIFQEKGEVVVLVRDNQAGARFNDTNLNRAATVNWGVNGPVRNIVVVGEDRAIKVDGFQMFDKTGDVRIQNLTLNNPGGSFCPFIVNSQGTAGLMRLFDITFAAMDPTSWQGHGMKWNIRGHGSAQWHLENLLFHEAQEHGAYIDNHQGDSYMLACLGAKLGRTFCQWTNRSSSGPTAFGDLVIKDCEARDCKGDGGSDYTIVGNGEGAVLIDSCKSFGNAAGSQGALVHWTDVGHGAYLTADGYGTGGFTLRNFESDHPNADRTHVAIDGVRNVRISNWKIKGNKTAIQLNNISTSRPDNGSVGLSLRDQSILPSQWSGWQAAKKIQRFNPAKVNVTLTPAEIDAMQA